MKRLDSHWTHLYDIWYLKVFRKAVEKIKVLLKSDKNNGYFIWRLMYLYDQILILRMRNISDKCFRENQVIHFVFSKFIFRKLFYL